MKPNWKDAPDWVRYLAMDANGDWYWYEEEPSRSFSDEGWSGMGGRFEFASQEELPDWCATLEERPDGN